jgi:hypothetical protein
MSKVEIARHLLDREFPCFVIEKELNFSTIYSVPPAEDALEVFTLSEN